MEDKVEGPFGFWPFPILNTIIEIVRLRNSSGGKADDTIVVKRSEIEEALKD